MSQVIPSVAADQPSTKLRRAMAVQATIAELPSFGAPLEVADGIWWIRLPLFSALGHVNIYAIEERSGWTVVDTGENSDACVAALNATFAIGSLARKPVTRVIATHYHPDHIGLAGWFAERGAVLCTTRLCWLYARMLQMDDRELPCDEQIQFAVRAGVKGVSLEAYRRRKPSQFSQLVKPIPFSYCRLEEGDVLDIGRRRWRVRIGHGHAAGHVTLWTEDGFAFTGDQILPGIASNLSVHASEPDEDLVSEWLTSCNRFKTFASDATLCFPGHGAPFNGARTRCEQLITNMESVLKRLLQRLERPATAVECLEAVYRRPLERHEQSTLIAETVGFLNHLKKRNRVRCELARDGSYIWQLVRA